MTLSFKHGATIYDKPIHDVLQGWRRSLASLLFFIILLTGNFGSSSSLMNHSSQYSTEELLLEIFGITSLDIPDSFSGNQSQCLHINRNTSTTMCSLKADEREKQIPDIRLKFCSFYTVSSLINGIKVKEKCLRGTTQECEQCFTKLEHIDEGLYALMCSFEDILARYDCRQINRSSSRFTCTDCLNAYKEWLCSSHLDYYGDEGVRLQPIPPCPKYCTAVLARCPYFLPHSDEQYAGQPAFLCRLDHEYTDGTSSSCYTSDQIPDSYSRQQSSNRPVPVPVPVYTSNSGASFYWLPHKSDGPCHWGTFSLIISWTFIFHYIVDIT